MRLILCVTLILVFVMAPLVNTMGAEWQDLAKIKRDDKIQVIDQHLKSYTGKFVAFSDQGITLLADKEMTIPKADVYRVTVVSRGRGRHTLRGLLFGAAIGLGIGAAASAPQGVEGNRGGVIASSTLLGAGIGALIGVAKQPHISIYQAERIKQK